MPGADVRLEFLHPDRVVGSVLEEKADIGIVSYPRPQAGLEVVPWREEPMVVACPPGHRFAGARAVPPSDLQDEAFVAFDRGLEIRRRIDRYLERNGAAVRVVMEFDNVEAIKRAVEAGSGIAILPLPALERERKMRSLEAVPLAGPGLVRPLGILHRRGSRRAPGALPFVTLLLDEAAAREP
jgi:DNA-binding transcriptional LysR family regulator